MSEKVLNKTEIFEELELVTERVPLKKGAVIVSEIGAADYIALWTDPGNKDAEGNVDMAKFTPALLAACIVDESGNRMFDASEAAKLARSSHGPFMKLAAVARRLNGLSGDESKNSEETATDDSLSGSVSTSDINTPTECCETSQHGSSESGESTTQ